MEKQGYRETLAFLTDKFPDKAAISIKEAANTLDMSESTIRDAIKTGKDHFPAKKVGGRVVIPIPQLARWMC
jgi:excisionase family DNA binding protein